MRYPLITITGPSGSGKTTVAQEMQTRGFLEATSTTTRNPRPGEEHGKDYYFVNPDEFQRQEDDGGFLEVVEFSGNRYGITRAEIEKKTVKAPTLVVVDGHGAEQILATCVPPSEDAPLLRVYLDLHPAHAKARMLSRGDSAEAVEKRAAHDKGKFSAWKQEIQWDLLIYNHRSKRTVDLIEFFVRQYHPELT